MCVCVCAVVGKQKGKGFTPEDVRDNWAAITDFTDPTFPGTVPCAIKLQCSACCFCAVVWCCLLHQYHHPVLFSVGCAALPPGVADSTTSSFEPIMAGAVAGSSASAKGAGAGAGAAKPKYGKSDSVDVEVALAHKFEREWTLLLPLNLPWGTFGHGVYVGGGGGEAGRQRRGSRRI